MSNPISTLPNPEASPHEEDANLEVGEMLDEDVSEPLLEIDPIRSHDNDPAVERAIEDDASESGDPVATPHSTIAETTRRGGLIALILAVILVGSIAINLKQSRDVASLEGQNAEIEQALSAAVERIDIETARANGAEAALERVDSAVDVVSERVRGLQDALEGLREATLR